jgi:hypothetical protein
VSLPKLSKVVAKKLMSSLLGVTKLRWRCHRARLEPGCPSTQYMKVPFGL